MTERDQDPRTASRWWPRRDPWRVQPAAQSPAQSPVRSPAGRDALRPPDPPPSPPMVNRLAGALLLAATLGLASCQAFIAVVT